MDAIGIGKTKTHRKRSTTMWLSAIQNRTYMPLLTHFEEQRKKTLLFSEFGSYASYFSLLAHLSAFANSSTCLCVFVLSHKSRQRTGNPKKQTKKKKKEKQNYCWNGVLRTLVWWVMRLRSDPCASGVVFVCTRRVMAAGFRCSVSGLYQCPCLFNFQYSFASTSPILYARSWTHQWCTMPLLSNTWGWTDTYTHKPFMLFSNWFHVLLLLLESISPAF